MEKKEKNAGLNKYGVGLVVIILGLFLFGLGKDSVIERNVPVNNSQNQVATRTSEVTTVFTATTTKVSVNNKKSEKIASETIKPCPEGSTDFECYSNYYTALVKQKGVPEAMKVLKSEYNKNSYVVAQCHPFTHVIGHAAISIYPNVATAFKHGDPYCWSGYYHGAMEEISERTGLSKITSEINTICSEIPGKDTYSFDYYNCVHGLGHGIMAVNENKLFDSLKICDNLMGVWEQSSCYGGVYMENVMIDNNGEPTDYLKRDDPLYPCNAVETKYKTSCYLMQTSYALKVLNQDYSKVFALCRKADEGFQDICWQSLGRDASGGTSSNAVETKAKCDLGLDYREKSNCVIGAVKDFISYFHSDVEAKNFCNILSPDLTQVCLDTAVSYYKSF